MPKNSILLNFGPQHPAAHGVLRLLIELQGEYIINLDPHIGLLHRGTEKLIEFKTFMQCLPYMDRLDYVSMMTQEHCFSLGIEYLLNIPVSKVNQKIRLLFDEITRLLNHLLSITTHALDVGALTPFLWGFEEREKLMFFYEKVSGARLHAAYIRPGGLMKPFENSLLNEIIIFCSKFKDQLSEIEELLTNSKIWRQRLQEVGVVSKKEALSWGFSGVLLRGSGIRWDLRKTQPYGAYKSSLFNTFKISVESEGDCYSRYKVRINEMYESIKIIKLVIDNLRIFNTSKHTNYLIDSKIYNKLTSDENINYKSFTIFNKHFKIFNLFFSKITMELIIQHFKYYSFYQKIKANSFYVAVEAPKGEFGLFFKSNNSDRLARCKIKAPGFLHLQGLNLMSNQHMLADLVTNIGTQDIVFGEVDR